MKRPRYLTKSRFKLACECPTKLFYTRKPEYPDKKEEDSFLMALANGGFHMGELAKCYFPGGIEIFSKDYSQALDETNELLKHDNVIIFEAAIEVDDFFIRVDILVKRGDQIDLIEVKSKSIDGTQINFRNKNGTLASDWKAYLYDIAFQNFVAKRAFPNFVIRPFLMLTDKSVSCPTSGLHQKLRVKTGDDGNKHAFIAADITPEDLSVRLLCKIDVHEICEQIYTTAEGSDEFGRNFTERAKFYRDSYRTDQKIISPISAGCGKCEFVTNKIEDDAGKLSGYRECWAKELGWSSEDFSKPTIFEISNYNITRKIKRFAEKRLHIDELIEDDISPKSDDKPGMTQSQRQWLQCSKIKNNDTSVFLDREGLGEEIEKWNYPLHFIDFETSRAAIPFIKGRHPYEGVAFQFSHHIVCEDGQVEHAGEYLNAEPGQFPNYDFVRALKSELSTDDGTIFRYHEHENSYLNEIYRQLAEDPSNIPDREILMEFIKTITRSSKNSVEKWEGERNMVDLCLLVKRYFYDPRTKGSNSIKAVLPAILRSSEYLRKKYAEPIYGNAAGITSKNFVDQTWIKLDGDSICDPYKMLPKMFTDVPDSTLELISEGDELNDGGAAMTAYSRLQYEDMSDYERTEIKKALLKYCELDTMAMVMIYEAWREMLKE